MNQAAPVTTLLVADLDPRLHLQSIFIFLGKMLIGDSITSTRLLHWSIFGAQKPDMKMLLMYAVSDKKEEEEGVSPRIIRR